MINLYYVCALSNIKHCNLHYLLCKLDSVEEDKMLAHGICKFCEDVCVDPASLKVLILAWTCRAAVQCEFTRAEFVRGMTELGWVTLLSNVIFIIILLCLHLYSN
jgi:hypothetical protein